MSTGAWVKAYGVALVSLISGASAMHWVLAPDTVRAPAPTCRIPCRRIAGRCARALAVRNETRTLGVCRERPIPKPSTRYWSGCVKTQNPIAHRVL